MMYHLLAISQHYEKFTQNFILIPRLCACLTLGCSLFAVDVYVHRLSALLKSSAKHLPCMNVCVDNVVSAIDMLKKYI